MTDSPPAAVPLITTGYTIYRPNGAHQRGAVEWPPEPSLRQIRALIEPIVEGPIEHVLVLKPGTDEVILAADMFVDELGHVRPVPSPRNEAATAIYRANWLRQHPDTDPETLPWIAGTAILFDRLIWN